MSRTQMTITYPDGCQETRGTGREELGVFGSMFTARRDREAQQAKRLREHRLLQLSRDIEALEEWHHAWRLEHDEDYRELHPGEWCEHHGKLLKSCYCRSNYRRFTELLYTEPHEIRTGDGTVIRRRPAQRVAPELTLEARRAATRKIAADWKETR